MIVHAETDPATPPSLSSEDLADIPGGQAAVQSLMSGGREVRRLIESHPAAAVAAAVGVGLLIGWWVKR